MSDERTHHVKLRLVRGYEFIAEFPEVGRGGSMLFDEPEPLGSNAAPNAAAVLGAAVAKVCSVPTQTSGELAGGRHVGIKRASR